MNEMSTSILLVTVLLLFTLLGVRFLPDLSFRRETRESSTQK